MRKVISILLVWLGLLVFTGCEYEAPLAEKQGLPIDNSIVGIWQSIGPDGKPQSTNWTRISRYSETEILIRLEGDGESVDFRGYPIRVAGVSCVQIQAKTKEGIGRYHVLSFELLDGELLIKVLNPSLVSNELKSSSELRTAFLRQKNNKDLFINEIRFRKMSQELARILANNKEISDKRKELSVIRKEISATRKEISAAKGRVAALDNEISAVKKEVADLELLVATEKGNLATVRDLLAKGISPNVMDEEGNTALMFAAKNGHAAVVKALLDKGADVNAISEAGRTALWTTAFNGHAAIVQELLTKGANMELKDNDGFTALMVAAQEGHLPVVQALLTKGVNPNLKNNAGGTALMFAAKNGHTAVVQELLAKHADVNAISKHGETALRLAAFDGDAAIVQELLTKGANMELKDNDGSNALMVAAQEGHLPVVQALLAKGANPNSKDYAGRTALMFAADKGNTAIVQALLNKGADVNAKTEKGSTALGFASRNGHTAVVEILRKAMNKPCPANLSASHVFQLNGRVVTGVVLKRGDKLTLRASGRVSFGIIAGAGGPEGINGFRDYNLLRGADMQHGALLARIKQPTANNAWYYIGKGTEITPDVNGTLELSVNDIDTRNNTGAFTVEVSICRAR